MKTLRQLCVASVLTLTFSLSAFAGEIQTTVTSSPPPQTMTANGEIQTTVTGQAETDSSEATAADSVAETAMNLLVTVLSIF